MNHPITLYSPDDFSRCTLTGHALYPSIKALLSAAPGDLITNLPASTQCYALELAGELTLVAQIRTEKQKTYTASLITHYFDYLQDELDLIEGQYWKKPLKLVVRLLGKLFAHQQLDDVVYIGNTFISTNFHSAWNAEQLRHIDRFIRQRFTTQRIVYRSLNDYAHQDMMKNLTALGYQRLVSRQVFITDQTLESQKKRNSIQRDLKLLKQTTFTLRLIDQDIQQYAEAAKRLYDVLYLDKYSRYNPQFTVQYFVDMVRHRALTLHGVFDGDKLVAIAGLYKVGHSLTTPLIGYDLDYPRQAGLYRIATLISLMQAGNGNVLNMSSGAGDYKMRRGAQVYLEYSYYADVRISRLRRYTFQLFAGLINWLGEKYGRKQIF
ncbi:hypothetical protein SOASR032_22630 [Pragia fontium]|uniref:BioF2-like acetyltransferase domain-containing protein n=1 Tax=Pragia fontium TaxID=82985 RepID=A0ABQ5LKC1_9GAMM|nr:GNAT family N-acetyltransferase [Pragia fontium]GKX63694.1 hypothetical protein SOASR032_22630 [Pragia fontium]